jgi:Domain of unknown function (DUF5666)
MTDCDHVVRRRGVVWIGAIAALVIAAGALTACSGGGKAAAGAGALPSSSPSPASNGGGGARGGPAASGTIAEIDGNALQVQNPTSGQTTVALTAKTAYTQTKATTLASVKVGSCIVATSPASTASSTTSGSASTPAGEPSSITAHDVTITSPESGSCERTGGGPGGGTFGSGRPSGFPSNFPSGAPSGFRTTGTRPGGGFGDVVDGKVTAVSGSTITVEAVTHTFNRSASASPSTSTHTVTVTVTSSTTFTHTVVATRGDVKVGLCATAFGSSDQSGAITATRLALSSPKGGTCSDAFGSRVFTRGNGGGGTGG